MALSPLGLALMMQPPPSQARPGTVSPTDTLGAYNLATNTAEQQYQAKLAQQNALWGGLAGLGSAGIIASPKLFGTGGPLSGLFSSAPAAAPSVASAAAPLSSLTGADAGSVAGDIAADTGVAAAGDAGADAAGGLAAILPFLFG